VVGNPARAESRVPCRLTSASQLPVHPKPTSTPLASEPSMLKKGRWWLLE